MDVIQLTDRGTVAIAGADAASLLQGLITCDIPAVERDGLATGALLSPQGKLLFDFILHADGDGFVADLPLAAVPDFIKRMKLYRLRAKVDLDDTTETRRVYQSLSGDPTGKPDPRTPELGTRFLGSPDADSVTGGSQPLETYHARRIALAVPEAPYDFQYGEVFAHDVALDSLHGIAFDKGCYVGQEVVSRMVHRGSARKRIVAVRSENRLPEPGTPLLAGDRPIGTLGSGQDGNGIAIVRLDKAVSAENDVTCGGQPVTLSIPDWATYTWPDTSSSAAE